MWYNDGACLNGIGMMGGRWALFHGIFSILVFALVVAAGIGIVRLLFARRAAGASLDPRASGLAALDERYARGEIDREEYLQTKADLAALS